MQTPTRSFARSNFGKGLHPANGAFDIAQQSTGKFAIVNSQPEYIKQVAEASLKRLKTEFSNKIYFPIAGPSLRGCVFGVFGMYFDACGE